MNSEQQSPLTLSPRRLLFWECPYALPIARSRVDLIPAVHSVNPPHSRLRHSRFRFVARCNSGLVLGKIHTAPVLVRSARLVTHDSRRAEGPPRRLSRAGSRGEEEEKYPTTSRRSTTSVQCSASSTPRSPLRKECTASVQRRIPLYWHNAHPLSPTNWPLSRSLALCLTRSLSYSLSLFLRVRSTTRLPQKNRSRHQSFSSLSKSARLHLQSKSAWLHLQMNQPPSICEARRAQCLSCDDEPRMVVQLERTHRLSMRTSKSSMAFARMLAIVNPNARVCQTLSRVHSRSQCKPLQSDRKDFRRPYIFLTPRGDSCNL